MKKWIGAAILALALTFGGSAAIHPAAAAPLQKAVQEPQASKATDFSARRYHRRYYRHVYRPYYGYGYRPYYRPYYYARPYYYRPYPYYAPAPFPFGFGFGPWGW